MIIVKNFYRYSKIFSYLILYFSIINFFEYILYILNNYLILYNKISFPNKIFGKRDNII